MLARFVSLVALVLAPGALPRGSASQPAARTVEFNRDVRPILSDTCFQCHGPDQRNRKGKLRLDTEAGAFADRGGYRAIEPGLPEKSELLRRVLAKDDRERMPPASTGHRLSGGQIDTLRRWIEQGAKWQKHWSLIPPSRADLPPVKDRRWPRNGIDPFILARLGKEDLRPAPEADRITLLRRVTLDLTGLPPTPSEVDAFLADTRPGSYERAVERLLASPRYGERMAIRWLEAARYADTNGYQTDGERFMWRWRDWVIEALNQNMPFDQFTIEQIAGDMLPSPTLEQRIATGFNRNHRGNAEGGVIPEEYAVEYVVDRVDTTATVWLGLTMGCAKCHDHKYDPVSQREFYQVFAYFNNVPERGKAVKYGNSPPFIKAPTREQQAQLLDLQGRLRAAQERCRTLEPQRAAAQARWEKTLPTAPPIHWAPAEGLVAHYPLDSVPRAKGDNGRFVGGQPTFVRGPIERAARLDGRQHLDAGNVADFGFFDSFTLSAWVRAEAATGTILSRMADTARAEGYSLHLENGRVQLNLVKRWLDDAIRVEADFPLVTGRWYHVAATYDGSRVAAGIRICIDGIPQKLRIHLDDINQSFQTKQPFRVGSGGGSASRFRGSIDEVRVYGRALPVEQVAILAAREPLDELAAIPPAQRGTGQAAKLRAYHLETQAPAHIRAAWQQLAWLQKEHKQFDERIPTTMVMEEMPTPRLTHLLIRGEYDKQGPQVAPGLPASLPPFPEGAPNNRLGFARWLVDRSNPLTARVTVNRIWQMYFGTGLVKSSEDFGSQGEWPSHPELLDWLAVEFMRDWDMKRLHRLIVTSSTYRQSSKVTPELLERDPDNRLLARGPRLRLSVEMIRDQALAVSGLLIERQGGPSVKPYQPPNLWKDLTNEEYEQDSGENLYRRTLYTFWKRTIAPPGLVTFDAPGREACAVRQTRTNTPLQALNLMNDVTYVEAARMLAQRVIREGGPAAEGRLSLAFRLATARPPRPAELQILRAGLRAHLARYRADPKAARQLLAVGETRPDARLDVAELAAYTAVASLILNLDETITRE
ncbi:MAG: DUF1553 domain-containing protein [Gemmataceae bacterium]|nr:DUF1553 domain-containing protein [Gemmataceae bacterium]